MIDYCRIKRRLTTFEPGNVVSDGATFEEKKEEVEKVAALQGDAGHGDEGTGHEAPSVLHSGASYCTRLSSAAWGTKLWSSVVPALVPWSRLSRCPAISM